MSSSGWAAPVRPTKEQRAEILKELRLGRDFSSAYEDFGVTRSGLLRNFLNRQASINDLERLEKLVADREDARKKRDEHLAAAVRLAGKYYNIHPAHAGQPPASGPFSKKPATWAPRVIEDTNIIVTTEGNSGEYYLPLEFRPDMAGVTMADGSVFIRMGLIHDALDADNPGLFAEVLYHESVHFDNLITKGIEGTVEEEEFSAQAATLKVNSVFDLPEIDQRKRRKDALKLAKAILERGEVPLTRQGWPTGEEAAQWQAKLKEHLGKSSASAAADADTLAAALESLALFRKEAEEVKRRAEEGRFQGYLIGLENLAMNICSYPGTVDQAWVSRFNRAGFPPARYRSAVFARAAGGPCTLELFGTMLDTLASGQPLNVLSLLNDATVARDAEDAQRTARDAMEGELARLLQENRREQAMREYLGRCRDWVRHVISEACAGKAVGMDFIEYEQSVRSLRAHGQFYGYRLPEAITEDSTGCALSLAQWTLDAGPGLTYPALMEETARRLPRTPPPIGEERPQQGGWSSKPLPLPTLPQILDRLR